MSRSLCRRCGSRSLGLAAVMGLLPAAAGGAEPLLVNGGFEAGLTVPWGTGQYSSGRSAWWNQNGCTSRVEIDETDAVEGLVSLHLFNTSPRAAQVYGTTAQPIAIVPNQPYRISLWAQGLDLASPGAVVIVVDDAWAVRPIALPEGSFAWTRLSAVFSLPSDHANVRILTEDTGEAWLDDITITPLESALY